MSEHSDPVLQTVTGLWCLHALLIYSIHVAVYMVQSRVGLEPDVLPTLHYVPHNMVVSIM